MEHSNKIRRRCFLKNSIALMLAVVSFSCLLIVIISTLRLPDASSERRSHRTFRIRDVASKGELGLGKFGEMMLEMLPDDLAFTVFVPSERAFERDLRLRINQSLVAEKWNDTYAVLSRILGFSAVPRAISSASVPLGKEISYDSLSGFSLCIWKDRDGAVVANRVRSERVDLKKREIVVHVIDGVIMDAEFEESVRPDDEEDQ
ncbi:uncharacterized protein LOC131167007 [Malania oleifera]|uniref:uncharacterized protein LOC131167007 n=1 Tax=Malania oleifera TaxID=397392 RepID=UPI0025ADB30E|nr:uncharacterized protein LOC131167007 [Malania oleifera]XP_057981709.1 uncharacterized protein LOC131167007 [Malania oleifera]XP_057981710.1 uncharacterized protein LOC131167007 [Malania oleifera]XP_057981711.1 uncharacterized protein LOC131167007 [Malania oleifera]